MKIQLIEEKNPFDGTCWYSIYAGDVYIKGSSKMEEIQELYNKIKENPDMLKPRRKVLLSEEIVLSSQH